MYKAEYDNALGLYNKILEKNAANQLAKKRIIALYKSQGKDKEAIDALNSHLQRSVSSLECRPQHGQVRICYAAPF